MDNQKKLIQALGEKIGVRYNSDSGKFENLENWYRVNSSFISQNGGGGLFAIYKNNLSDILMKIYPDFEWDPLQFIKAPQNYWDSAAHQKLFMDELGVKLGIFPPHVEKDGVKSILTSKENMEKWYKVSSKAILENGGGGLLARYKSSRSNILRSVYPDFDWDPLKFLQVPRNHWADFENQKVFVENLREKLKIKEGEIDPWYNVTYKTVVANGGGGLLTLYDGRFPVLLQKVYPELKFDMWRFPRGSLRIAKDSPEMEEVLSKIEKGLHIKSPIEWQRVSLEQIANLDARFGKVFLGRRNLLAESLTLRYPKENWDHAAFTPRQKSRRRISSDR